VDARVQHRLRSMLEEHRAEILEVAARHGATCVRVIGSVARGEEHADSDVDLVVRFESGRSVFDLSRFRHDLEQLLGVPVDVVSEGALLAGDENGILADVVEL
jgi:uncharacterized protein